MHSLNDSGIEPDQGQDRDLVDQILTGAFVLCAALATTAFAMPFLELVTGPPAFWGHGLVERFHHSSVVPLFWGWSAMAALLLRHKRRQRAMRARNHPDPLEMPTWFQAWYVVIALLLGLDTFTRLHGASWLEASEFVFMVPGFIVIAILLRRRRKAQGIPFRYSARQKTLLILMAVVAVMGLLVPILLAKWMR